MRKARAFDLGCLREPARCPTMAENQEQVRCVSCGFEKLVSFPNREHCKAFTLKRSYSLDCRFSKLGPARILSQI